LIQFGKYVNEESNDSQYTLNLYGLFNWYNSHANNDYLTIEDNRVGWDLDDWNDQGKQCIKINNIYAPIPISNYQINKYWSYYQTSIPPFSAITKISFNNYINSISCNDNEIINYNSIITLGSSDENISFYSVPPIVQYYPKWKKLIDYVLLDNYIIPTDYFYISNIDTDYYIKFNNQQFNFEIFDNAKIYIEFYNDVIFNNLEKQLFVDNFDNSRQINWVHFNANTDNHFEIINREPELSLQLTSNVAPYSIINYKNAKAFKLENKSEEINNDKYSGTNNNDKIVGVDNNDGYNNIISLSTIESNNYEYSCDIIFDKELIDNGYEKKFEIILKAENNYNYDSKTYELTDFYFVGIGSFDFDIGFGMRSVQNNEIKETYLASWGEYNTKGVKVDTWYTLKVKVTPNEIKVFFNEKFENPRLILNYNTNKKFEKLTDRYLKGQYETLQAILIGLEELQITYPTTLGNKLSQQYSFDNFKEEFASTLPINGNYVGFRTYNPNTYISNVNYLIFKPKVYKFATTTDNISLNQFLVEIKNNFTLSNDPSIKKYDVSTDFVEYVQIDDTLYYRIEDNPPQKYINDIETFKIVEDKVLITEKINPTDGGLGVNLWTNGEHTIIWSLEKGTDPYNIVRMSDFFDIIDGLIKVELVRGNSTYTCERDIEDNLVGYFIPIKVGDQITFTIDFSDLSLMYLTIDDLMNKLTLYELNKLPIDPLNPYTTFSLDGSVVRYNKKIRCFTTRMNTEIGIFIKDKTFYYDNVSNFEEYTDKKIREIYINDNKLNVIFEDIT
jgi:hypothetical protein